MQVYAILLGREQDATWRQSLASNFPDNFFEVSPLQWLVAANKTAQEISSALVIGEGQRGHVMVLGISSFYGWHRKEAWDWMSLKSSL